jgi:hypothetical protein
MMISDMAYRDMEASSQSVTDILTRIVSSVFRRRPHQSETISALNGLVLPEAPRIHLVAQPPVMEMESSTLRDETPSDPHWRKHPMLRASSTPTMSTPDEQARLSRAASTRALFLSRSGRFDEARAAFVTAARDLEIDLSDIPGFWNLSRAGMQAAIEAYEEVERFRDAARLEATIRLKYRPRLTPLSTIGPRSATGH